MLVEVFELRIFSVGEDDYICARTFHDYSKALLCLKGAVELGFNACLGYYSYHEKEI